MEWLFTPRPALRTKSGDEAEQRHGWLIADVEQHGGGTWGLLDSWKRIESFPQAVAVLVEASATRFNDVTM